MVKTIEYSSIGGHIVSEIGTTVIVGDSILNAIVGKKLGEQGRLVKVPHSPPQLEII